MQAPITVRIPEQRCPHCGFKMKWSTKMGESQHDNVRPGDITLCIGCWEVFRFNDQMRLKRATKREMKWIMQLHGEQIIHLQNLARLMNRRLHWLS